MAKVLVGFWIKRFALVFVLAGLGLAAAEALKHGAGGFSYASVIGWSASAALLTASLATYWAYRVQCKVVFKQPAE